MCCWETSRSSPGHLPDAIDAWKRIEGQNPAFLALVAERIYNAYRQLGRIAEGVNLLRGYLSRYPSLDLLNVAFHGTLEVQGAEPAYRLVSDELRRAPTLLGLDKLLEAQLLDAPPERRRDLELVKSC
jgi:lipopolysaccharide biosynthesis regulator YciM